MRGCARGAFYSALMQTQGATVGLSAPRARASPKTWQTVCAGISAQCLPCCGIVDTPFNQCKPQSSSVKWAHLNQHLLLPGGFNGFSPVEHLGEAHVERRWRLLWPHSFLEDPPSVHWIRKAETPASGRDRFVGVSCSRTARGAENSTKGQG